jgi:hypothetical protein
MELVFSVASRDNLTPGIQCRGRKPQLWNPKVIILPIDLFIINITTENKVCNQQGSYKVRRRSEIPPLRVRRRHIHQTSYPIRLLTHIKTVYQPHTFPSSKSYSSFLRVSKCRFRRLTGWAPGINTACH